MLGATALGFFAFVGFEDSVNMAEEAKDPARNFPRAIFIGVAVTGTIYVLVALVSSLLVDSRTLADSSGPLLEVVKAGGVDFPPKLFALIALFAVTNSALINIMMASRLCYGMANERILPPHDGQGPARAGARPGRHRLRLRPGDRAGLHRRDRGARRHHVVPAALRLRRGQHRRTVLRKDRVDHQHFRTPTALPVLGAITALVLASPLADRGADVYVRAGILLLIGIGLWAVNKAVMAAREKSDRAAD